MNRYSECQEPNRALIFLFVAKKKKQTNRDSNEIKNIYIFTYIYAKNLINAATFKHRLTLE